MKVYVASSWRNMNQPSVVAKLRSAGHEAYDFKDPEKTKSFHWSEIDEHWKQWKIESYRNSMLTNVKIMEGYNCDMDAIRSCDACVMVLPCGRSSHIEAGFCVGAGKPLYILLDQKGFIPELMYRMAHSLCVTVEEVLTSLHLYAEYKKLEQKSMQEEWKNIGHGG